MRETDVPGIKASSRGILLNDGPSSGYEERRKLAMKEKKSNERLDGLESELSEIKQMLAELLNREHR